MNSEKLSLFVSCAPSLETLLLEELQHLNISSVKLGYRGVYVDGWDWTTIYTINYASRLANRVLLPIKRFKCFDKRTLYRHASEIDWSDYLKQGLTFAIDANVHHKELRNSLFAAQVVKDAICDQLRHKSGWRPSIDLQNPDIQLNLFIQQNHGVISFDTSGAALHKRGYRQESVEAPLQETLAAGLLYLAKYDPQDVFLDPCCGSGTLLIEAALIASKTPPGYLRQKWGFMRHFDYKLTEWLKVRNELDAQRQPLLADHFFGLDVNKNAVRATKINLKAAGFKEVDIQHADFREFTPVVIPNFVLTNPPHGRRLEDESHLQPLYRALGDFLKQECAKPSRGFIFTGNLNLAKEVGLSAKKRYVLSNGGIDSRLLAYDLY